MRELVQIAEVAVDRRESYERHLVELLECLHDDRADFVGRLFTKPRPAGLSTKSSAREIMDAYWDINTSLEAAYRSNLQAIFDHLTKKRKLPLSKPDLDGIEWVYYNFWWWGPSITYNSSSSGGRAAAASTRSR